MLALFLSLLLWHRSAHELNNFKKRQPWGERITNEYDPTAIGHAARLGAELGADLVKVSYTGDVDSFRGVVEGRHVPVIIAGGPRMDSDRALLEMVRGAMDAGAAGTSIGRNVFQHERPDKVVAALGMIVHQNATVDEAMEMLRENSTEKEEMSLERGPKLAA